MRPLKVVLISAAAALAAGAFVTASASATALCPTNTSPCATFYKSGKTIIAKLKTPTTFTNAFSNVTCDQSALDGKITSEAVAGKPVSASITSLTFAECETFGNNPCTVTASNLPWAGSFNANGGGNGSLLLSSSGIGSPSIYLNCDNGEVMDCNLKATTITLSVAGGNPAIASGTGLPLSSEGPVCWKENKWDIQYEFGEPKPLFVVF
jgi:hypothetical protein